MRRGGESIELSFAPRKRPDGAKLLAELFGLEAKPLDEQAAKRYGFARPVGLVITGVRLNSAAATMLIFRSNWPRQNRRQLTAAPRSRQGRT